MLNKIPFVLLIFQQKKTLNQKSDIPSQNGQINVSSNSFQQKCRTKKFITMYKTYGQLVSTIATGHKTTIFY